MRLQQFMSWFRKRKLYFSFGILILMLLPFALHSIFMPLELNQFLIQKLRFRYGVATLEELGDTLRSAYSSGLNILQSWPSRRSPEYSDTKAMFEYVFNWVPTYAVVYPTEGFYYWKFQHDEAGETWGNIRIADLDKGELFFTYFRPPAKDKIMPGPDAEDFGQSLLKDTLSIILTEKDGIRIEKKSQDHYIVTYRGKAVSFHINPEGLREPQSVALLPQEEFVGRVHDESGIKFLLLYNRETFSFYYILDKESGLTDRFEVLDSFHVIGKRSGFVFFTDSDLDRELLVGVDMYQSERNSYFDGPQDQVPFRANLRDRLYEAYPNTMLDAGCDEHGVLLGKPEWARVAIAPFSLIRNSSELLEISCKKKMGIPDKSNLFTALTKEFWNNSFYRQMIAERLFDQGKVQPISEDMYLPDSVCLEPASIY